MGALFSFQRHQEVSHHHGLAQGRPLSGRAADEVFPMFIREFDQTGLLYEVDAFKPFEHSKSALFHALNFSQQIEDRRLVICC
jgi:hypothetical protein